MQKNAKIVENFVRANYLTAARKRCWRDCEQTAPASNSLLYFLQVRYAGVTESK